MRLLLINQLLINQLLICALFRYSPPPQSPNDNQVNNNFRFDVNVYNVLKSWRTKDNMKAEIEISIHVYPNSQTEIVWKSKIISYIYI